MGLAEHDQGLPLPGKVDVSKLKRLTSHAPRSYPIIRADDSWISGTHPARIANRAQQHLVLTCCRSPNFAVEGAQTPHSASTGTEFSAGTCSHASRRKPRGQSAGSSRRSTPFGLFKPSLTTDAASIMLVGAFHHSEDNMGMIADPASRLCGERLQCSTSNSYLPSCSPTEHLSRAHGWDHGEAIFPALHTDFGIRRTAIARRFSAAPHSVGRWSVSLRLMSGIKPPPVGTE